MENAIFEEKYNKKTITGGLADKGDLVGYCHYIGHKGYLLRKHIKDHNCIGKGCHYFEKNDESLYYKELDFARRKRHISKRLTKLSNANIIPMRTFFELDRQLKGIQKEKDLEAFCKKHISIKMELEALIECIDDLIG